MVEVIALGAAGVAALAAYIWTREPNPASRRTPQLRAPKERRIDSALGRMTVRTTDSDWILVSDRIPGLSDLRLYIGWDVPPSGVHAHWPTIDASLPRTEGHFVLRGSMEGVGPRLEEAYVDLLDLRRAASAGGLELVLSGGYWTLTLKGAPAAEPGLDERAQQIVVDWTTWILGDPLTAAPTSGSPSRPAD